MVKLSSYACSGLLALGVPACLAKENPAEAPPDYPATTQEDVARMESAAAEIAPLATYGGACCGLAGLLGLTGLGAWALRRQGMQNEKAAEARAKNLPEIPAAKKAPRYADINQAELFLANLYDNLKPVMDHLASPGLFRRLGIPDVIDKCFKDVRYQMVIDDASKNFRTQLDRKNLTDLLSKLEVVVSNHDNHMFGCFIFDTPTVDNLARALASLLILVESGEKFGTIPKSTGKKLMENTVHSILQRLYFDITGRIGTGRKLTRAQITFVRFIRCQDTPLKEIFSRIPDSALNN